MSKTLSVEEIEKKIKAKDKEIAELKEVVKEIYDSVKNKDIEDYEIERKLLELLTPPQEKKES